MKKMNINQAINYAKTDAKKLDKIDCPCASDHRQIASWLEELKVRRKMKRNK